MSRQHTSRFLTMLAVMPFWLGGCPQLEQLAGVFDEATTGPYTLVAGGNDAQLVVAHWFGGDTDDGDTDDGDTGRLFVVDRETLVATETGQVPHDLRVAGNRLAIDDMRLAYPTDAGIHVINYNTGETDLVFEVQGGIAWAQPVSFDADRLIAEAFSNLPMVVAIDLTTGDWEVLLEARSVLSTLAVVAGEGENLVLRSGTLAPKFEYWNTSTGARRVLESDDVFFSWVRVRNGRAYWLDYDSEANWNSEGFYSLNVFDPESETTTALYRVTEGARAGHSAEEPEHFVIDCNADGFILTESVYDMREELIAAVETRTVFWQPFEGERVELLRFDVGPTSRTDCSSTIALIGSDVVYVDPANCSLRTYDTRSGQTSVVPPFAE